SSLKRLLEFRKPDQVGDARIDAALKKQRRQLPGVMRLVVEEVRHREPQRSAPGLRFDHGDVLDLSLEPLFRKRIYPRDDFRVGRGALGAKLRKIGVELARERVHLEGAPLEPPEPD